MAVGEHAHRTEIREDEIRNSSSNNDACTVRYQDVEIGREFCFFTTARDCSDNELDQDVITGSSASDIPLPIRRKKQMA